MKKLFILFLLIGCVEQEPIKINRYITDLNIDRQDNQVDARTLYLCQAGYPWTSGGSTATNLIPNIHWKKDFHYFTNQNPASTSGLINASGGPNYKLTIKITNTGTATFKFSTKNGAVWQTLTPGQYYTFQKDVGECDITGYVWTIVFDLYRLSCGDMSVDTILSAVTGPHTLSGFNASDFHHTWNAPGCSL